MISPITIAERNLNAARKLRDSVKIRLDSNTKLGKKAAVKSDEILLRIVDETIAYWMEELVHAK